MAEIERRWRTSAPEEQIGEGRYSLWKVDVPLLAWPPRFSRTFFAVVVLVGLGLIAIGSWVAGRIRQGDFLAGQIFGIGLFVTMYGGMFAAVIANRRRTPSPAVADSPPEGVVPQATACHASVRRRGRCVGWLWFEGDLMCFRGAGFDFRLRREDFQTKGDLRKVFRNKAGALLKRPKGVSEYGILLSPGAVSDGAFIPDPSLWADLEPEFGAWESGSFSREPSLFPPIRPVPTGPIRFGWAAFVVPALVMGGLMAFAAWVLPFEPVNGKPPPSPTGLTCAGALFGLMWPLLLWTTNQSARAVGREADRTVKREGLRLDS